MSGVTGSSVGTIEVHVTFNHDGLFDVVMDCNGGYWSSNCSSS